jgi:hypothetical protein
MWPILAILSTLKYAVFYQMDNLELYQIAMDMFTSFPLFGERKAYTNFPNCTPLLQAYLLPVC